MFLPEVKLSFTHLPYSSAEMKNINKVNFSVFDTTRTKTLTENSRN